MRQESVGGVVKVRRKIFYPWLSALTKECHPVTYSGNRGNTSSSRKSDSQHQPITPERTAVGLEGVESREASPFGLGTKRVHEVHRLVGKVQKGCLMLLVSSTGRTGVFFSFTDASDCSYAGIPCASPLLRNRTAAAVAAANTSCCFAAVVILKQLCHLSCPHLPLPNVDVTQPLSDFRRIAPLTNVPLCEGLPQAHTHTLPFTGAFAYLWSAADAERG